MKSAENTKEPPKEQGSTLALIALIVSIVGLVFSFGSGAFLLVLALLLALAAIIMGAIAVKTQKTMAIITIVIGVIGLLFSVTGFSRGSKTETSKVATPPTGTQETASTNTNTASTTTATTANTNSAATATTQKVDLPNTFSKKELGYSINYPKGWTAENPDNFTTEFKGGKGTPQENFIFRIQNVLPKARGGAYDSVDDAITKLTGQIKQGDKNAVFSTTESVNKDFSDGSKLAGKVVGIQMAANGGTYQGALTVLSYDKSGIFFVIEYYAPKANLDEMMSIATSMIGTWVIGQ
jgi:hypothetical protein